MTVTNGIVSDLEYVMTRVFDAPRDLVFKAYTEPGSGGPMVGPAGHHHHRR